MLLPSSYRNTYHLLRARIAQLVEHLHDEAEVRGSRPRCHDRRKLGERACRRVSFTRPFTRKAPARPMSAECPGNVNLLRAPTISRPRAPKPQRQVRFLGPPLWWFCGLPGAAGDCAFSAVRRRSASIRSNPLPIGPFGPWSCPCGFGLRCLSLGFRSGTPCCQQDGRCGYVGFL